MGRGVMSTATLGSVPPAVRRRLLVRTLLRAVLTVVVLVVLYYNLPLDQELDATAVALLLAGLLALTGLISWQVRGILRSSYPALRAVSAPSTSTVGSFLLWASSLRT